MCWVGGCGVGGCGVGCVVGCGAYGFVLCGFVVWVGVWCVVVVDRWLRNVVWGGVLDQAMPQDMYSLLVLDFNGAPERQVQLRWLLIQSSPHPPAKEKQKKHL